ncbi:hypothetical protein HJ590_16540 [Naumannella sp. ID2617S]|uniref:Uncharacterized protein n=1 Tax=Enemella dayhoffiae TaxID=2016507 RepID=A0A255GVF7_9ACTN|nr:hypothetical protein [Enemella dayhoffiae]NNG21136.1 hypothetical protein [Naumannella sp. ID2617S]OYO17204.1 hypothetical protein CGZ93_16655 [Enemella dayhoffiae]
MPLFQTFDQMVAADPHRLAADAFLATFAYQPLVDRNHLDVVLRDFCVQKGPKFLGINTGDVMPVEICEARCILVWERALAASTRIRGRDSTFEQLILLDYRLMSMNPVALGEHFKLS